MRGELPDSFILFWKILPRFMISASNTDNRPCNSLARMLCGANHRKGTVMPPNYNPRTLHVDPLNGHSAEAKQARDNCLAVAKLNLKQCIVGMQSDWKGSVQALHKWLVVALLHFGNFSNKES